MKGFLLVLTALLCLLCIPLYASAEALPTAPEGIDTSGGAAPTDTATRGESDAWAQETVGGRITAFFETYAGEILSGLTLLGSILLMCGYKRGFLPTLCSGLDCLTRSAEAVGTEARASAERTQEELQRFTAEAESFLSREVEMLDVLETLRTRAEALEIRLAEAADEKARETILWRGVADLLYGVFSAANLPDYAKEQLGARYAALLTAAEGSVDAGADV